MKKNKMMRVAAVMLVCVLLSTSIISGTFAKYVTAKSVGDIARVAKWGVTITAEGTLFENHYSETEVSNPANTVVSSNSSQNVVAPGTTNMSSGLSFTIAGVPEVSVNVAFEFVKDTDVCLPAGTYKDYTDLDSATGTFTLDEDYHPLVYTLKHNGTQVAYGTLEDIKTYLMGSTVSKNYKVSEIAGTNLSALFGNYTLTWAWAFGENSHEGTPPADLANVYNKADTYLGMVAAGATTGESPAPDFSGTNETIETGADVSIRLTVTQID